MRNKYFHHLRQFEASNNPAPARKRPCPAVEIVDETNQVLTDQQDIVQPLPQRTEQQREAVIDNNYSEQIVSVIDDGFLGVLGSQFISVASIVNSINIAADLTEATVNHAEHLFRRLLTLNLKDHPELMQMILSQMPEALNKIRVPLKSVNTRYYFEKYFTDLSAYIKPIYKPFMTNKNTVN
jgi:hypothetical protein